MTIIKKEKNFDFKSPEYRALFANSNCLAFQHPVWLHHFYETLAPAKKATPIIITGRCPQTNKLQFVIPLISRRINHLTIVDFADLGVNDYATPIVCENFQTQIHNEQLQESVAKCIGRYDILRIKPIRDEDRNLWQLFISGTPTELEFGAHFVNIPANLGSDWRKKLFGKKNAKSVMRKKRRMDESENVSITELTSEQAAKGISKIRALRTGRFEGDPIQEMAVRNFYQKVATDGVEENMSSIFELNCDGKILGLVFGLNFDGRFYYLLIGCDYDKYGHLSPGIILFDHIMEKLSSKGESTFDFTIGDEPFKSKFGTTRTTMWGLTKTHTLKGRVGFKARKYQKMIVTTTDSALQKFNTVQGLSRGK